jgi:hypothetical protein
MAFTNPYSTKTARVSTIAAAETNLAGSYISQAIDGSSGGDYTPVAAPIRIGGAQGLRIMSGGFLTVLSGGTLSVPSGGIVSAASGSTVTLSGATTASDLTMTSTNRVKLASRSITRVQSSVPYPKSATWSFGADGTPIQVVNDTDELLWSIRVPHGATLTSVQVGITPSGGHGGVAPTMPSVSVGYEDSGGSHNISTVDDATVIGSYEAYHEFGPSGLSHVVDRSARRYFALISGETGGSYQIGLRVHFVKCTYTITEYDED